MSYVVSKNTLFSQIESRGIYKGIIEQKDFRVNQIQMDSAMEYSRKQGAFPVLLKYFLIALIDSSEIM